MVEWNAVVELARQLGLRPQEADRLLGAFSFGSVPPLQSIWRRWSELDRRSGARVPLLAMPGGSGHLWIVSHQDVAEFSRRIYGEIVGVRPGFEEDVR